MNTLGGKGNHKRLAKLPLLKKETRSRKERRQPQIHLYHLNSLK